MSRPLNEQRPDPLVYFERYGAFADNWELGHVQYVLAFLLRAAWDQDWARVTDLASLMFVMNEQASLDGGSTDLGFLYTLLPEPPIEALTRQPPRDQVRQAPRIADPEWTAALLGYLTSMDTLNRRRSEQLTASRRRARGRGRLQRVPQQEDDAKEEKPKKGGQK